MGSHQDGNAPPQETRLAPSFPIARNTPNWMGMPMTTPVTPRNEEPVTGPEPSSPPLGYGAALMEAVRPRTKPFVGYGAAGAKADPNRQARAMAAMAGAHAAPTPATRPPPMPKRPKGRIFIASFLTLVGLFGLSTAYNALLRFQSYGVVSGHVIQVPPTWAGVVTSLYVREGDDVRQGELLAIVSNLELQQQHAKLSDDIRVEQANMEATLAEIRLDTRLREDQRMRVEADYWELYSTLVFEQYELMVLSARRTRLESQAKTDRQPITAVELEEARTREKGQREKVDKLAQAGDELKSRLDKFPVVDEHAFDRLRPHQRRIEALQAQLERARDQLTLGEIRAPHHGRVLQVPALAGEYVAANDPVVELLVEGTLGATLYIEQERADQYPLGGIVELHVAPAGTATRCEIVRVADQLEPPPKNIELYYRQGRRLLPVVLRPLPSDETSVAWRLGAEVCEPTRFWTNRPAAPDKLASPERRRTPNTPITSSDPTTTLPTASVP